MPRFEEKVVFPADDHRNSYGGITISSGQFRMKGFVHLTIGRHQFNFSPEAARLIVSTLFGAIEHIEASDSPSDADDTIIFSPGDLVRHPKFAGSDWSTNQPRGCLVYGVRGGTVSIITGPGEPIEQVPSNSLTIIQREFRPRHWYPE